MVKAAIEEFSKEYSLDKNAVKDYLLKIIEERNSILKFIEVPENR